MTTNAGDRRPDDGAEDDPAVTRDKHDPAARPDQPTPSDEATLAERDDGAHAEYVDAPSSLAEARGRDHEDDEDDQD